MKKMKKVFAMLLALAMVLGMSMTAFAGDNEATITVSNIAKAKNDAEGKEVIGAASVQYLHIIQPAALSTTNTTGWDFVDSSYADAYKTAYGLDDAQAVIQALINEKKANDYTQSASKTSTAINTIATTATGWSPVNGTWSDGTANWKVTEPGIYLVKITQSGFTYTTMAAYVGFSEMEQVNGELQYPAMNDATLIAKGSDDEHITTKTSSDTDKVVAVGDTMNYTIETVVPFVQTQDLEEWGDYMVKDTLEGATFDLNSVAISYKDGGAINKTGIVSLDENVLTVNLSSQLVNNANANKTIVITYTAKVTSVDGVTNTAQTGHQKGEVFDPKYGTGTDKVFTGKVVIEKVDVADDTKKLADAGFEVRKNNETDALTFREVYVDPDAAEADRVVSHYEYDPEGTVTTVKTGANGTATIKGLDVGTYSFKEVEAPNGYSINESPVTAEVKLNEGTTVATSQTDFDDNANDAQMADTTLTSLPSTGGIGTTIFTIAGCLIMVVAAGLFFASRRKSAVK